MNTKRPLISVVSPRKSRFGSGFRRPVGKISAAAVGPDGLSIPLFAWFKADAIVASDNDRLATWADSSGNGRDLSQATGSKQPKYNTNIQNGKPAVQFDGTAGARYFRTAAWTSIAQPISVAVVAKSAGASGNEYVHDGLAVATLGLQLFGSAIYFNDGAGSTATSITFSNNVTYLLVEHHNGASSYVRSNTSQSANINPGNSGVTGLTVGVAGDESSVPLVDLSYVMEICLYNGTLTAGDITNLESSLNTKYAIY